MKIFKKSTEGAPINMTIKQLKRILRKLPNDMPVVIPVVLEDNVNSILGFRYVRTAGILRDDFERAEPRVLCLNGAAAGFDIATQVKNRDVACERVMF